jgi:hypothetical protein
MVEELTQLLDLGREPVLRSQRIIEAEATQSDSRARSRMMRACVSSEPAIQPPPCR